MARLLTVMGFALGLFAFHASEAFAQCGGGGGGGGVSLPPMPPAPSSRQTSSVSAGYGTSYYSSGASGTRLSTEEVVRRLRLYGTTSDPDLCPSAAWYRPGTRDTTGDSTIVKCGGLTITNLEPIAIRVKSTIVTLGRDDPLRETAIEDLDRKGDKPHKTCPDAKALDLAIIGAAPRSSKQGDR